MWGILMSKEFWAAITLLGILIYASVSDVRFREVGDWISIMIIVLAVGMMSDGDITKMLLGGVIVALPMIAVTLANPPKGFGGADIKMAFVSGFLLGMPGGVLAVMSGLIIAVIVMVVFGIFNKESIGKGFPLIPFLSAGLMVVYVYGRFLK